MNKEINKIISLIEMSYTILNYKEELSLVNYIKQLQQENKKYKIVIENIICEIKTELKEINHLSYETALSIAIVLELLNKVE